MAELDTGPCESWPIICDDFPEDPDPDDLIFIEESIRIATEVLWNRTKKRFGTCGLTLRPCRKECFPGTLWPMYGGLFDPGQMTWPFPALVGGMWINLGCGSCSDGCSCSIVNEVVLPYPVAEIEEVVIDGNVLPEPAYRVDNHRLLVRTDGGDWPRCNDLSRNAGEPGTWTIAARYGEVVPHLGQMAAGQLASAIFKACRRARDCPIPASTITQVSRQGVTKVFFDANTAFKNGKVGLYYPDLFIATYNPSSAGVSSIFDIDGPRRRYTSSSTGES